MVAASLAWARDVLIPIALAMLLAFVLSPVTDALQRWRFGRVSSVLVVVVLAFLLAGSLRQLGLMQLRLGDDPGALITDSGLERGVQAPEFVAAHSETEEPVSLYELPPVPRLLVFASPGCLSCRELIPGQPTRHGRGRRRRSGGALRIAREARTRAETDTFTSGMKGAITTTNQARPGRAFVMIWEVV